MASTNFALLALMAALTISSVAAFPFPHLPFPHLPNIRHLMPVVGGDRCERLPLQPNFNAKEFEGTWNEVRRTFNPFELDVECARANYTLESDGSLLVREEGRTLWGYNRRLVAVATPVGNNTARFNLRYINLGFQGDFEIVLTDYKTYALVRSCSELSLPKVDKTLPVEMWWLLGRPQKKLEGQDISEIYSKVPRMERVKKYMKTVNQDRCIQDEFLEE